MWVAICSGASCIRNRFGRPMPPMTPMRFIGFDLLENVTRSPPTARPAPGGST
jgi:hypothetical protein